MKRFSILIVSICLLFAGCSQDNTEPEVKTAAQLVQEGWQAYSSQDYQTAVSRFNEALQKDTNIVDGYNGAGWSNAKLSNLVTAQNNFMNGLSKDTSNIDIKAGLSFIYNAQKNYAQSITIAGVVLQSNPNWLFRRDTAVNSLDLHLLLAEDYFAIANYDSSVQQVKILNPLFNVDVSTVAGQTALAQEIERLHSTI